MELSEVHNKEVLILNWLPVYGLRLSLAICASEKLIVSGRQFSNEIPRRQAGCSQILLKINILTEIYFLTNQGRSIKQTKFIIMDANKRR